MKISYPLFILIALLLLLLTAPVSACTWSWNTDPFVYKTTTFTYDNPGLGYCRMYAYYSGAYNNWCSGDFILNGSCTMTPAYANSNGVTKLLVAVDGTPYYGDMYFDTANETHYHNLTVHVKNLANTVLPNVYVSATDLDSLVKSDYTDVTGTVTINHIKVDQGTNTIDIEVNAGGLYQTEYLEDYPFANDIEFTIYLTQGSAPEMPFYNITYTVKDYNSLDSIVGAIVEHTVNSELSLTGNTNSEGNVSFNLIPVYNEAGYVDITASGYRETFGFFPFTSDMEKLVYMHPAIGNITPTPTVTPTPTLPPLSGDNWSFTFNPTAINLGESSQSYLHNTNTSKMVNAKTVDYYVNYDFGGYVQYTLIAQYHYNDTRVNWDYRPNTATAFNTSPHDPWFIDVTPEYSGTVENNGNVEYHASITGANSVSFGTGDGNLLVGENAEQNLVMSLQANDGSNMNGLSNFNLILTDSTGLSHEYDNVYFNKEVSLQRGQTFTLTGSKDGYDTNSKIFTVPIDQNIHRGDYGAIASVLLFPTGVLTEGKTTVTVIVLNKDNFIPIPFVDVTVNGVRKTTNSEGGGVYFVLNYNTTYTIQYSKTGYCAGSDSVTTTTTDTLLKDVYMKSGSCIPVTPTPTFTYTPIPTTQPTPTTTGGTYVNGTFCREPTNLAETIDYVLCTQGFGSPESDGLKLLKAAILCFALAFFFGYLLRESTGAAMGVIAGIFFGFVISLALGFIPMWLFFVIFVLGCIIFGLWLYGRG